MEGPLISQLVPSLAEYLQIAMESNELSVMKISAYAIGKLSRIAGHGRETGTFITEMINSQIIQACDVWQFPHR